MIRIKEVGLPDLDSLVDLFDAYRIFYRQSSDQKAARSFLSERLKRGEAVAFLAVKDDKAIGFVNCYHQFSSVKMSSFVILNDLYVLDSFRNLGVGRKLIDKVKKYAAENGFSGVQLETEITNEPGNHLYPKSGFYKVPHNLYFWSQDHDKS